MLKVDTPTGAVYRRYNDDGYGEYDDGRPYDGNGVGRAWPLLAGERAPSRAAGRGGPDRVSRTIQPVRQPGRAAARAGLGR